MTHLNDLTPFGLFLLGDEPTIEDFILLIGTIVAFIAFVLWCCFPIQPKDSFNHQQFSCQSIRTNLTSLQSNQENANALGRNGSTYTSKMDNANAHSATYHCCNSSNDDL